MAVGELLVFGRMLSSFPQPCLSFDFCSQHNWNLIFFQDSHFRRLMNSQISSRIVKTWRNKLQSVVHKITASWESFTDHLHPDGFMLTGYSQSECRLLLNCLPKLREDPQNRRSCCTLALSLVLSEVPW